MIPPEIIKLAIEGGWDKHCCGYRWYLDDFEKKEIWNEEAIILNPLFWKAIGQKLGWEGYDYNMGGGETWKINAHRFFDLLLTEGDTAQFWKEIITNKGV